MSEVEHSAGEALTERLRDMPFDFFKTVKEAPEHLAVTYYEEVKHRRELMKERVEEAQACLKALKWEDRSNEETRWEIMNELMDKVDQADLILEHHQDRRIRISHRVVLEAQLLAEVSRSLSLIITSCAECGRLQGDKMGHERFVQDFREHIRYVDRVYYDVHMGLLKSYLEMPW